MDKKMCGVVILNLFEKKLPKFIKKDWCKFKRAYVRKSYHYDNYY